VGVGVNACASVIAAVLATPIAMHLAFHAIVLAALGLYAAAAMLLLSDGLAAPSS
jgi:hypothetical protein